MHLSAYSEISLLLSYCELRKRQVSERANLIPRDFSELFLYFSLDGFLYKLPQEARNLSAGNAIRQNYVAS
jgi:hypothetical protein